MVEVKKDKALKLIEVQDEVRKLIKFDVTQEDIKNVVEISKKIIVSDLEDKGQLKIAKDMKIKLRKFGIEVEGQVKDYRSFFNTINKEISSGGTKLIEMTTSEIDRLAGILEEADKLEHEKKMIVLLPVRKERLLGVNKTGCYICADEYLKEMDANEFEEYFNKMVAVENQRKVLVEEAIAEEKRQAEQKKIDNERAELEAEKQKIADDKKAEEEAKLAKEKEDYEIEQKRRAGLLPERRKSLEAIGDTVPELADNIMLAMDDNEYTTYYNNRVTAKNNADKQAIENKRIADEEVENKRKAIEGTEKAVALIKTVKDLKHYEQSTLRKYNEQAEILKERFVVLETEEGEAEAKAQLEKKEAYKKFLKEHGYTQETRDQFETREVEGGYELWKKVGVFNK